MKQIFTSIDIGSDTVKLITVELHKGKFNLLASSIVKSKGITKGVITDQLLACECIHEVIKKQEDNLGFKIKKVITTIPSLGSRFKLIKGIIHFDEVKNVTGSDVSNVIETTIRENLPIEEEVINIIPIDFMVDDTIEIKDPKGLTGTSLALRAIMATVPSRNVYSVITVLESLGLEVKDISISGMSDIAHACYKGVAKGVGAIINIGSETTTVSVFNKGIIVRNSVIFQGGDSVDNDLSYMYRVTKDEAKELKERFVLAHKRRADNEDVLEITNQIGDTIRINQYEMSEVVQARLEEIVTEIRNELESMTNKHLEYIYVTGGMSNIPDFKYILDDFLGKSVIIGDVDILGIRDNKYSVAIGNVIAFIDRLNLRGINYSMLDEHEEEEISSVKRNAINISDDSMLGKVFGYFFNE